MEATRELDFFEEAFALLGGAGQTAYMSKRQNLPHLLFLHGLGDNASAWDIVRQEPALTRLSCTAVDLPGFGGETWTPQSLPELAEAIVRDRIAALEGPVVVVGHSMGGVLATFIAEHAPANLAGIINVEGNLTEGDCFFSQRMAEADDIEQWISQFGAKHDTRYARALATCDPRALRAGAAELVKWSTSDELTSRYDALEVPKLYVYGTKDTSEMSQAWLHETHQSTVCLEGIGHFIMDEEPELFATVLLGWLVDLPSTAPTSTS